MFAGVEDVHDPLVLGVADHVHQHVHDPLVPVRQDDVHFLGVADPVRHDVLNDGIPDGNFIFFLEKTKTTIK